MAVEASLNQQQLNRMSYSTDITPPPFGLVNATPSAAGVKTNDPTPAYIEKMRAAAFDAIDSADEDQVEDLVQISRGLTKPYDPHTVKAIERMETKNKSIDEKLKTMLRIQKYKK